MSNSIIKNTQVSRVDLTPVRDAFGTLVVLSPKGTKGDSREVTAEAANDDIVQRVKKAGWISVTPVGATPPAPEPVPVAPPKPEPVVVAPPAPVPTPAPTPVLAAESGPVVLDNRRTDVELTPADAPADKQAKNPRSSSK